MRWKIVVVATVLVALGLAGGVRAQTCDWTWVNSLPPRTDILRLKQETFAFVGVGLAGTIIRSADGFTWEQVDSSVDGDLHGIDWGAGTFVVVGQGVILRSPAGYGWVTVYENPDAALIDVEFSVSRFVAVGDGLDGHLLISELGFDWELVPVPWSGPADSIAGSNDGFFVAVDTEIWFSADGLLWDLIDEVPAPASVGRRDVTAKKLESDLFELDRRDLAWTGSRLLWSGGSELWSRESTGKWELVSTLGGCQPWSDWLGVVAGPGWAMASGISGCPTPYLDPTVTLIISVDGGETFRQPWETEMGGFPALARYGSRWVAAGALGDVMTSSNGVTWECNAGSCTSLACADDFADLAEGDDGWVAVGGVGLCDQYLKRRSGGTSATSAGGRHWQVVPHDIGRFRGVTFAGSEFIGVGDGWLARSDDGIGWTTESFIDGASLLSVESGAGRFVTVGQRGALYVSDDGVVWGEPFLFVTADLDRVAWVGDQFLVVGHDGTILRSPLSVNWVAALSASTADLKGAAGGPERKIIVGLDGVILGSPDGIVWTPLRSGVDTPILDVTWGNGRFVAVGWEPFPDGSMPGVVLASVDGESWTRFSVPGEALNRVRWTGSSWLAVGGERTILKADCLGTLIAVEQQRLQVPLGETVDMEIRLSEEVDVDRAVSVSISHPGHLSVSQVVRVLAGSNTATVPVTGVAVITDAVVTLTLPESLGGGSTTFLATVQPPGWTPRRPSGRVSP